MRTKPDDPDERDSCDWRRRAVRENAMVELEKSSVPVLVDARVEVGGTPPAKEEVRRIA